MPDLHLVDFFLCEGTVDGDVLKDVVLLGPVSNNGREYSLSAMRSAVPLYEGHAVYADHNLGAKMRRIEDRFGHVENVRVVEQDRDGKPRVRGDLHFMRTHRCAPMVLEAYAKKQPYHGVSHVADGVGRKEGGKTYVEQITKLSSLDLVDRAATGSLVEQADAAADPAAAHTEALTQMVVAIMSDPSMDKAAKKKKLEALLDMQDDAAAPPAPDAAPPPMSEATLRKVTGELVEQAVAKALTTALPQLVEQETARRAAEAKYVKPNTQPPGGPPAEPPKKDAPPTDPAARKKWLHSN